jgi:hypothetical protein
MHVGTGKATAAARLTDALARGRHDHQFFSHFFLGRKLHDGQLEWVDNAVATINVLPTGNRYGKTTMLLDGHCHKCIYKTGAEPKYLDLGGNLDLAKFERVRFQTAHTAFEWETAALVWDEMLRAVNERAELRAFIKGDVKLSKPPHVDFITGSRWKFRTLGHDSRGIDGHSFYLISVDEAGWLDGLEEKMNNVVRVRIADVMGVIWLVGTMKPGISRDFYKYGVRAAAHTGASVDFAFTTEQDDDLVAVESAEGKLDPTIVKLCAEFGIEASELQEALDAR